MFIYDGNSELLYSKTPKSDEILEVCYCFKGQFPGKNIRKDDEERHLFVLTDEQEVTIFLNFSQNNFRKKIEIFTEEIKSIIDFRSLENDKVIILGSKCEVCIYRFSNFSAKLISQFYIDQVEVKKEELEAACISVCPRNTYVAVSAHNFYTGSKRRLNLLKIDENYKINLLTVKQYQHNEPERNSYLTMNFDFYINENPLLLCYENSSSGQVIAYLIKNERFEIFQVFDKFMSHYCYFSTVYANNIWSIDNTGKIRCLEIKKEHDNLVFPGEDDNFQMRRNSLRNFEDYEEETSYGEEDEFKSDESSVIESDTDNDLSTPYTSMTDEEIDKKRREDIVNDNRMSFQVKKEPQYEIRRDTEPDFGRTRRYKLTDDNSYRTFIEEKKEETPQNEYETKLKSNEKNPFNVQSVDPSKIRRNVNDESMNVTKKRNIRNKLDDFVRKDPRTGKPLLNNYEYEVIPRNDISNIKDNQSEISDYFNYNGKNDEEKVQFNIPNPQGVSRGHSFVNQDIFNDIDTPIMNTFTYEQEKVSKNKNSPYKLNKRKLNYSSKETPQLDNLNKKFEETIGKDYLKKEESDIFDIQDLNDSKLPFEYSQQENDPTLTEIEREKRLRELRHPNTLKAQRLKKEREDVMKEVNSKQFRKIEVSEIYNEKKDYSSDYDRVNRTARGTKKLEKNSLVFRENDVPDNSLFEKKPPVEVFKAAEKKKLDIQDRFKHKFVSSQYVPPAILSTNRESKRKTERALQEENEVRLNNFNSFQNENYHKPEIKLRNCFKSPMIYKTGLTSGKK